jgi:hypothetical protein
MLLRYNRKEYAFPREYRPSPVGIVSFHSNGSPAQYARRNGDLGTSRVEFPSKCEGDCPERDVSAFRVSGYDITFEKTNMKDVEQGLGGIIGKKGDAGDASEWLCFHGADAMGGWVLWLENGEINGGSVGSFQWQRLSNRDVLDTRCHTLRKAGSVIQLPLSLQLGAKSSEVLKSLGPPTLKTDERLIYLHEHEVGGTGAEDPFISSNIVVVHLRNGMVWAIQVSKTTSD